MTLASVGGHLHYPEMVLNSMLIGGGWSSTQFVLDADGEKVSWIFAVPKDGTIKKIGFLPGTVVGTTNGVTVSIQDIDATSGDPDGTPDDSVTGVAVASDTWVTATLPTGVAVQAGQFKAVVVEFTSFVASDSVVLTHYYANSIVRAAYIISAYCAQYASAAWTKSSTGHPNSYIEYSDGSVVAVPGIYPCSSKTVSLLVASDHQPDEVGLFINSLPFGLRAIGLWSYINPVNGASIQLSLLDGSNTVLGQFGTAWDEDFGTEAAQGGLACLFDPITLTRGSTYRVVMSPQSTVDVSQYYLDVAAAGHLAMYPGGTGCQWTSRYDTGAWSQLDTRHPLMGIIYDQIDIEGGGRGDTFRQVISPRKRLRGGV